MKSAAKIVENTAAIKLTLLYGIMFVIKSKCKL